MTNPTRVAVVTGASSGIGAECARTLGSFMAVALVARRADPMKDLAAELPGATVHVGDLRDLDDVVKVVQDIVAMHGTVDVLVNNAGLRPDRLLTTMPLAEAAAEWANQLNVNATIAFNMAFAIAPHLRRPGGRIINVGSMAAQTGGRRSGSVGYAAAKAAVHGLTLGLSRELAPAGITVNTIVPGYIAGTEFTESWSSDIIEPIVRDTPVGRGGSTKDVAAAVAYLASPDASFITAQSISVNGGMVPTR